MEKKLKALCVKHELLSMSVGVWPGREKAFAVYIHPNLETCGFGDGKTVAEAVDAAMLDLNRKGADPEAA